MADHEKYLELLGAYTDGGLTPDEEKALMAHIAECPDCAGLFEILQGTAGIFAGDEEPPAALLDGVMAGVKKIDAERAANARRRTATRWLAVAAVFAIIIIPAARLFSAGHDISADSNVMRSAEPPAVGDEDGDEADEPKEQNVLGQNNNLYMGAENSNGNDYIPADDGLPFLYTTQNPSVESPENGQPDGASENVTGSDGETDKKDTEPDGNDTEPSGQESEEKGGASMTLSFPGLFSLNEFMSAGDLSDEKLDDFLEEKDYSVNGVASRDDLDGMLELLGSVPFPILDGIDFSMVDVTDGSTLYVSYELPSGVTCSFVTELDPQAQTDIGEYAVTPVELEREDILLYAAEQESDDYVSYFAVCGDYVYLIKLYDAAPDSIDELLPLLTFGDVTELDTQNLEAPEIPEE